MRLIDADALIDDCKKYLNELNPSRDGKECARIHWLIGILSNAHAIEPERKTGKWVKPLLVTNTGRVRCSVCSAMYDWDMQAQYFNFCPNCGAVMEGSEW